MKKTYISECGSFGVIEDKNNGCFLMGDLLNGKILPETAGRLTMASTELFDELGKFFSVNPKDYGVELDDTPSIDMKL